jgi:hypothetical protein
VNPDERDAVSAEADVVLQPRNGVTTNVHQIDALWLYGVMRMLLVHAKNSNFIGGLSTDQLCAVDEALDWLNRATERERTTQ